MLALRRLTVSPPVTPCSPFPCPLFTGIYFVTLVCNLNPPVTAPSCCVFGALSNSKHGLPQSPHLSGAGPFLLELEVRASQRNRPLDDLPRGHDPHASCGRSRDRPG